MRPLHIPIICAIALQGQVQTPPEVRIGGGAYAPRGAVISVQSNLVEMTATVRDSGGRLLGGLRRDDFELFEDGKARAITAFSELRAGRSDAAAARSETSVGPVAEDAAPRAIALFFDDTHIATFGLNKAKIAARKFAESGLHPGDRLAVYTDSGDVVLDLTADRKALAEAVDRVKPHPLRGASGVAVCPTLTPYQAYVITKHLDAMALAIAVAEKTACDCPPDDDTCPRRQPPAVQAIAADTWSVFEYQSTLPLDVLRIVVRALSHAPGQRILLMVSPGFITGGMERMTGGIANEAVRAHVTINALDSEGVSDGTESPDAKAPGHLSWAQRTAGVRQSLLTGLMKDAAEATGGRFIENSNDISGAFDALTAAPEISYLIAFAPPGRPDDKYHALKLRLKNEAGYRVESRPGYFSALPEKRESAQDRIDSMAESSGTASPFPVTLKVAAADSGLRVDISVDATHLKFSRKEGRHIQEVTFVTLLEDAEGNFIAGKQAVMDLAVTNTTLAALEKDGMHVVTAFPAQKGSYRVREIVREAVENRIAAANTSAAVK